MSNPELLNAINFLSAHYCFATTNYGLSAGYNVLILLLTNESNRLSKNQLDILNDQTNNYLLPQTSYYEMAIKLRLGKLEFDLSNVE